MDVFRPNDSLSFLANYMMKHKNEVKNIGDFFTKSSMANDIEREEDHIDNFDNENNEI